MCHGVTEYRDRLGEPAVRGVARWAGERESPGGGLSEPTAVAVMMGKP